MYILYNLLPPCLPSASIPLTYFKSWPRFILKLFFLIILNLPFLAYSPFGGGALTNCVLSVDQYVLFKLADLLLLYPIPILHRNYFPFRPVLQMRYPISILHRARPFHFIKYTPPPSTQSCCKHISHHCGVLLWVSPQIANQTTSIYSIKIGVKSCMCFLIQTLFPHSQAQFLCFKMHEPIVN